MLGQLEQFYEWDSDLGRAWNRVQVKVRTVFAISEAVNCNSFSSLMLLIRLQEGHLDCKNYSSTSSLHLTGHLW